MGKKTNLKATLLSHQEKQRKAQLQKAKEAAKKEVVKNSRGKPSAKAKGKRPQQPVKQRSTIPISSSDTILLIGEGNFSFARALFDSGHSSLEFLPPANVVATTYDSEEACYTKYPDAKDIVQGLQEKGVCVLFNVDARRLDTYKELKKKKWQRIIWNFPHAGKGISDQDRNVLSNQILILDFLKSIAHFLEDGVEPRQIPGHKPTGRAPDDSDEEPRGLPGDNEYEDTFLPLQGYPAVKERGTVLITLRNTTPYTLWDLPRLAKKPPPPHPSSLSPSIPYPKFVQRRSFVFRRNDWKGYEHRMTKGWVEGLGTGADKVTEGGKSAEDRMWELHLAG